tara:strand:- start:354 stop:530 length:177 start_codon:yes stop_codon:yes gene_type:complete
MIEKQDWCDQCNKHWDPDDVTFIRDRAYWNGMRFFGQIGVGPCCLREDDVEYKDKEMI